MNYLVSKQISLTTLPITEDIPATEGIRFSGIPALQNILFEIATPPPFELNIEKMSNRLGISRTTAYVYLEHLEQAGLII